MASPSGAGSPPAPPLRGELRYGVELARLLADPKFRDPTRRSDQPPALLVPGFMAGDQSLGVLAGWLRRRGSHTARAGILLNADCAERAVARIDARIERLAERGGGRIVLIGQSRGGALARVAAVRNPELVSTVVMLGSPVVDPLAVGPTVLGAVRSVARLGDLGVPRMLSTECRDGECCASFRHDLKGPLPDSVRAVAIYSRSDGIVSWRACLDPFAEQVEVDSSHTGMSVNPRVYDVLARIFDGGAQWSG
jgi:pimeloyl-ACP methyl ester carboxylesterase